MQEMYQKSLQMIKQYNISTPEEYIKLVKDNLILNIESLKWMTQTRRRKKILKIANEV